MREIKFRAWDKNGKKMIGPYEITNDCICDVLIHYGSSDLIWMQFTGLHDKNFMEIWEGDIIQRVWHAIEIPHPFPQASSSPPKPKTDHKGRKQILSRRESASILGIRYREDDEHDD